MRSRWFPSLSSPCSSPPSDLAKFHPLAESASVDAEIARFRAIDAQKEKEHKKKMKGKFLRPCYHHRSAAILRLPQRQRTRTNTLPGFLNKAEKKGGSISLSDKDTSGLASSFASGAKIEEVA